MWRISSEELSQCHTPGGLKLCTKSQTQYTITHSASLPPSHQLPRTSNLRLHPLAGAFFWTQGPPALCFRGLQQQQLLLLWKKACINIRVGVEALCHLHTFFSQGDRLLTAFWWGTFSFNFSKQKIFFSSTKLISRGIGKVICREKTQHEEQQ